MKRIVQLGGMLIALGMLFASCQMETSDSSVSGYSADSGSSNINGISIGIKSIVNTERTILPADWTATTAGKLTYVLWVKKSVGGAEYEVKETFSYSELTSGTAKVNLEMVAWDLRLTGYITEAEETPGEEGKHVLGSPCLEAEQEGVDFTTGLKSVTFDLKPVTAGTAATGGINVSIAWLTTKPKRLELGVYDIGKSTADIINDKARGTNAIITKNADASAFTGTDATAVHTYTWEQQDGLTAGMYKFAAVFYDATSGGNVIGYYIDYLYVDGGNLSKATINYGDKFNTTPENPTWLAVKTLFVPEELESEVAPANTWYLAEFHWNDNSTNETGFELVITDNDATANKYVVNPTTFKTTDGNNGGLVPSDTEIKKLSSTLSAEKNTLDAGRTSVVLKLTTGKLYTAKIRAINDFTPDFDDADDDDFCDNLNRNGDGQGTSYAPIVGDDKQFGMFTVNYKLDGSKVAKEGGTTGDSVTNYVVGYNYHSEQQNLMTDSILETPHLVKKGYTFAHWRTIADKKEMAVTTAKYITNTDLEPVWKGVDVRVSVTFPSYADAADVKIAKDKNEDNTVIFEYDKTGNSSMDVTAGDNLETPEFELTDPKGVVVTDGISVPSGSKWTWAPTEAPTPGIYRLQITGMYEDAGSGRKLKLSGNVYIEVQN